MFQVKLSLFRGGYLLVGHKFHKFFFIYFILFFFNKTMYFSADGHMLVFQDQKIKSYLNWNMY